MGRLTTAIFVSLLVSAAVSAQTRIEKNVIFGMHSGLALLMDVHRSPTVGCTVSQIVHRGVTARARRSFVPAGTAAPWRR